MRTITPTCSLSGHDDFSNSCALGGIPWIFLTTGDDRKVRLWRIEDGVISGEVLQRLPDVGWKCALSEDGQVAAVACNDGKIYVWNTASRQLLHSFEHNGYDTAFGVDVNANGSFLAGSFFNSYTGRGLIVRYYFPSSSPQAYEQASWSVPLYWDRGTVRISRNGEVVAIASSEGLFVFEGSRGTLLFSCSEVSQNFDIAISAFGRRVVIADKKRLRIFFQTSQAVNSMWKVRTYEGYTSPITPSCSFSCDGKTVIAAMNDGSFRVWSVFERNPLISLVGHTAPGRGCAINNSGSLAITTSADRTVKIWELNESEHELKILPAINEEDEESSIERIESSRKIGEAAMGKALEDNDDGSNENLDSQISHTCNSLHESDDSLKNCSANEIDIVHDLSPDGSLEDIPEPLSPKSKFQERLDKANDSVFNPRGSRLVFAIGHMTNHWCRKFVGRSEK